MIQVTGLKKAYNGNQILKGIDFHIKKGEIVTLVGPSGSGKTTTLRSLNWLEQPDAGEISIGDIHIQVGKTNKKEIIRLREQFSMVFQHYNLWTNKTALENITEALIYVKKMPKKEAIEKAENLLKRVGLADKRNEYPVRLSGGQQQRIGIARALAVEPQVMLFDEPTSALDPEWVGGILELMSDIAQEGMTMLVVSHEMRFVRSVSSRVLFLDKGKIIEDSTPDNLFNYPKNERVKQFLAQANLA